MMNAIIRNKENTLILKLPQDIYDLYDKTRSIGLTKPPQQIKLTDNEDGDIGVKLYSEDNIGNHLIMLLNENNTLADANMLDSIVNDVNKDIQPKLIGKIANDKYDNMQSVVADIKKMLDEAGPIKTAFYCPLIGRIEDDEGMISEIDGRCLQMYKLSIDEKIEDYNEDDTTNMAEYFDSDLNVKQKLVSMVWGVEAYRGKLFGKIECGLKENLTENETEILKNWICGQNADGWGEGFEQQEIYIEEGRLCVSFWNSSDDYAIMTGDELDELTEEQGIVMGGM